ncbi:MAG: glycoside hydrolase family 13 protein [Rhodoferax sp.]|uniref:glycoside hydrolase family 13 protein n=1 Tax=Rhodoferax sp. TaxID=50421 RepID=UPI0026267BA5|nr:glycoside hydrolase family 13 protein [Rhodoferax sp.]MDD5335676.1 glycoside hydrolase family 13 protein [Rhodoferax sp.]
MSRHRHAGRATLLRRGLLTACAILLLAPGAAQAAAADSSCRADPLGGRALYLRGSFNSWNASDSQKFSWICNRYELVTRIMGQHRFKLADEGWSADADFGRASTPDHLTIKGAELQHHFDGVHRFTLTMNTSNTDPSLRIENCPAEAPLGQTTLFLRGSMNNWAALDDYAFQYSCDAYYLNVNLPTRHEFKIADAAWQDATSFGHAGNAELVAGGGNLSYPFTGEHTLRLVFAGGRPQLSIGEKTFADPSARAVTDPVARSLRFDSRAIADKSPFGAQIVGSTLSFGVTALPGVSQLTLVIEIRQLEGNQELLNYTEVARLPMTRSARAGLERWSASHRFSDVSIYGYWFEAQIDGKIFVYQNNRDPVFWTREKGSGGLGEVADKPLASQAIRRFRQTIYAADFKVPQWAPDIVYYYIFPDRFRNGDPANDPQPGRTKYHDATVELHHNWLDKPWKPGSGDGSDVIYNNDFFGGDLAGIIEKLDYIQDLGANTIYLTPVFKAASNHKYDTTDYKNIDPGFGSNEDFVRLTKEAAKRGIRVITDTSLNHTGSDSIYFDRFGNHQSNGAFEGGKIRSDSPYASWYSFDARQAAPDKQYKGWVGVTDLPELNKASSAFRKYAYGDHDSVMKLWLDRGAAGWRMDVAPWVPDDFWREWRSAIKQHRPDALTVAETWFDASKYFLGDMFDSTMNYIFRNTVLEYAAGGKASELYRNIELMREAYPAQAFYALMNLLSTHDQARSLHYLGWQDDNADAEVIQRAKQRLKLAMFFQMTFPGAPAVYYGDEVGVTGGDDPYNRAPYPWADQGGRPDTHLLAEVKRLIKLRNANPVLRRGSLDAPLLIDDHVIVLGRQLGDKFAISASNNAETPSTVRLQLPANVKVDSFTDAVTGASVHASQGQLSITIPALFGTLLLSQ